VETVNPAAASQLVFTSTAVTVTAGVASGSITVQRQTRITTEHERRGDFGDVEQQFRRHGDVHSQFIVDYQRVEQRQFYLHGHAGGDADDYGGQDRVEQRDAAGDGQPGSGEQAGDYLDGGDHDGGVASGSITVQRQTRITTEHERRDDSRDVEQQFRRHGDVHPVHCRLPTVEQRQFCLHGHAGGDADDYGGQARAEQRDAAGDSQPGGGEQAGVHFHGSDHDGGRGVGSITVQRQDPTAIRTRRMRRGR